MRPFSIDPLSRFFEAIRQWSAPPVEGEEDFGDPAAGVREPRRNAPSGRSSAIALVEPNHEPGDVEAVSTADGRFRS